jgi:hypothetical protein
MRRLLVVDLLQKERVLITCSYRDVGCCGITYVERPGTSISRRHEHRFSHLMCSWSFYKVKRRDISV